jgi:hypothetical protein
MKLIKTGLRKSNRIHVLKLGPVSEQYVLDLSPFPVTFPFTALCGYTFCFWSHVESGTTFYEGRKKEVTCKNCLKELISKGIKQSKRST